MTDKRRVAWHTKKIRELEEEIKYRDERIQELWKKIFLLNDELTKLRK